MAAPKLLRSNRVIFSFKIYKTFYYLLLFVKIFIYLRLSNSKYQNVKMLNL